MDIPPLAYIRPSDAVSKGLSLAINHYAYLTISIPVFGLLAHEGFTSPGRVVDRPQASFHKDCFSFIFPAHR